MARRAPLIGLLVAIVLAALFFFFVWRPLDAQETALNTETATLQAQADQLEAQLLALRDLATREVEIRAELARLRSFLPTDPAQPATLRELQLQADAAGVTIVSVTFGDPVTVEGAPATGIEGTALASIPITMIIDGGYFQTVDFFRRIEFEIERSILVIGVQVAESPELGFPSLATTWNGELFAILPVTPPAPVPGATGPTGPTGEGAPPPAGGEAAAAGVAQ